MGPKAVDWRTKLESLWRLFHFLARTRVPCLVCQQFVLLRNTLKCLWTVGLIACFTENNLPRKGSSLLRSATPGQAAWICSWWPAAHGHLRLQVCAAGVRAKVYGLRPAAPGHLHLAIIYCWCFVIGHQTYMSSSGKSSSQSIWWVSGTSDFEVELKRQSPSYARGPSPCSMQRVRGWFMSM